MAERLARRFSPTQPRCGKCTQPAAAFATSTPTPSLTATRSVSMRLTKLCMLALVGMLATEAARDVSPTPAPPPADLAEAGPLLALSTSRCAGTDTCSVCRSAALSCSALSCPPGCPGVCCACCCCACCAAATAAAERGDSCLLLREPEGVSCRGVASLPSVFTSCKQLAQGMPGLGSACTVRGRHTGSPRSCFKAGRSLQAATSPSRPSF